MDLQLEMILNQLNITQLKEVEKWVKTQLKKKATEKTPALKIMTRAWLKYYKDKKGVDYVMSPKDYANLKQVLTKIETTLLQQKVVEDKKAMKDGQIQALYFFKLLGGIDDKWLLNNLDIPTFNSNFNKVHSRLAQKNMSVKNANDLFKHFD